MPELPENVGHILQKVESNRKVDVVDKLCGDFEKNKLYTIKDDLFKTAKVTYEGSIGISCDFQLAQRRKEKSKIICQNIWKMYIYIIGFSEYVIRDILNSSSKQSIFGDEGENQIMTYIYKADNDIHLHVSTENKD